MPSKYTIHTRSVPHRFEPVTRSGVIAWEEGCLKCAVCVKSRCIYGVYDHRGLHARQMIDSIDNQCMNCLRCVQSCPKELIHKSLNPEYEAVGDTYWTPDIVSRLWYQAETGKIPVSGAGYPGPFSGAGFDSMWTDMSEIVRPTRDGIHGREYISTAVDLGRTRTCLSLTESGDLDGDPSFLLDIPLPIIMRVPPFGAISAQTLEGWAMTARRLGTLLAFPVDMEVSPPDEAAASLMPAVSPVEGAIPSVPDETRIVEIPFGDGWKETVRDLREKRPSLLICVKVPMTEGMVEQVLALTEGGVSIVHLAASPEGRFLDDPRRYLKNGIRRVHDSLVEKGLRDGMTLLAGGGLAMAEHVAKAIICGADAVFVDLPLQIALECRVCRRCTRGLPCPVEIDRASPEWVAARCVNLLGAWHNQLLELMGAMGIRDARRLRGETGRAMFYEDLDESTFGSLGVFEEGCELE